MGKQNITFLLGAGASKNACMPVCNDIGNPSYYEFLKKIYGDLPVPGIENFDEISSQIQNLKHSFEEHLAYSYQVDRDLYLKLIYFYQATLSAGESAGGICTNPLTGKVYANYYRLFAEILTAGTMNTSVISFNHDLWIEHSLSWQDFHYGTISENAWGCVFLGDCVKDRAYFKKENTLTLLKLHGSFNYLACEKCRTLVVGEDYIWHHFPFCKCPKCGESGYVYPYYVPPLKNKSVTKFENIWDDAARKLKETDYLIVAGYSLPDYDYASKDLLANNLNEFAEVVIVDKYAKEISKRYKFLKCKALLYIDMEFEQAVYSLANGTFTNYMRYVGEN